MLNWALETSLPACNIVSSFVILHSSLLLYCSVIFYNFTYSTTMTCMGHTFGILWNHISHPITWILWGKWLQIDLIKNSQNAPVPYPTMLHSEQKCAHFCSEWNSMAYGISAFWNLWNCDIAISKALCIVWGWQCARLEVQHTIMTYHGSELNISHCLMAWAKKSFLLNTYDLCWKRQNVKIQGSKIFWVLIKPCGLVYGYGVTSVLDTEILH